MASSTDTRAGSTVPLATAALRGLLHGASDAPRSRPSPTRPAPRGHSAGEALSRANRPLQPGLRDVHPKRLAGAGQRDERRDLCRRPGWSRHSRPRPTVFFGGFGEPLSHPRILDMIVGDPCAWVSCRDDHECDAAHRAGFAARSLPQDSTGSGSRLTARRQRAMRTCGWVRRCPKCSGTSRPSAPPVPRGVHVSPKSASPLSQCGAISAICRTCWRSAAGWARCTSS